jgi:hypothetical protein
VAVTKIINIKTIMGIKPVLFDVVILSNRQTHEFKNVKNWFIANLKLFKRCPAKVAIDFAIQLLLNRSYTFFRFSKRV